MDSAGPDTGDQREEYEGGAQQWLLQRVPNNVGERAVALALAMCAASLLYLRGVMYGSPLSKRELASQMASSGPYWPFVLFSAGMVFGCAGFATWWFHER